MIVRFGKLPLFMLVAAFAIAAKDKTGQAEIADEMETYRAIQNRAVSPVQDLANPLLMYRSKYGKLTRQARRLECARDLVSICSGHGTFALSCYGCFSPDETYLAKNAMSFDRQIISINALF